LQVHPTLAQAQAGYAEEERRGVPAAERNYRDAKHKPELLCALTQFRTVCGFRPVAETGRLLEALIEAGAAELKPYRERLAEPDGLRAVFSALLTLAPAERSAVLASAVGAAAVVAGEDGEWAEAARSTLLAAQEFPGDIGAALCLLLNTVVLRPGQAIFLGAGNVHAYLRGVGIEIMANSDNVLRCGLTPKRVDVPELLRITDFTPVTDPLRQPVSRGAELVYEVPVEDFLLSRVNVDTDTDTDTDLDLPAAGGQVLLCTDGAVTVRAGTQELPLPRGRAVFVAAGHAARLSGAGTVFRAQPHP
jgi:mannose-6-phosphate isomerase